MSSSLELSYDTGESENCVQSPWKTGSLPFDLFMSLLCIYPTVIKNISKNDEYKNVHRSFICNSSKQGTSKCLSTRDLG